MTVTLNEFSASSMDILVRCYVTAVDYTGYLQLKSRMNLAIMDLMKRGMDATSPSIPPAFTWKKCAAERQTLIWQKQLIKCPSQGNTA